MSEDEQIRRVLESSITLINSHSEELTDRPERRKCESGVSWRTKLWSWMSLSLCHDWLISKVAREQLAKSCPIRRTKLKYIVPVHRTKPPSLYFLSALAKQTIWERERNSKYKLIRCLLLPCLCCCKALCSLFWGKYTAELRGNTNFCL